MKLEPHGKFNPWSLYKKGDIEAENETLVSAVWELFRRNPIFRDKFEGDSRYFDIEHQNYVSNMNEAQLSIYQEILKIYRKQGADAYNRRISRLSNQEYEVWEGIRDTCPRFLINGVDRIKDHAYTNHAARFVYEAILCCLRQLWHNVLPEKEFIGGILDKSYPELDETMKKHLRSALKTDDDDGSLKVVQSQYSDRITRFFPIHLVLALRIPIVGFTNLEIDQLTNQFRNILTRQLKTANDREKYSLSVLIRTKKTWDSLLAYEYVIENLMAEVDRECKSDNRKQKKAVMGQFMWRYSEYGVKFIKSHQDITVDKLTAIEQRKGSEMMKLKREMRDDLNETGMVYDVYPVYNLGGMGLKTNEFSLPRF